MLKALPLGLAVVLMVSAIGSSRVALAFSESTTNAAVEAGSEGLDECGGMTGKTLYGCVGEALFALTEKVRGKRDYDRATFAIRKAVDKLEEATTEEQAVAAIEDVRKKLLSATGRAKKHFNKFYNFLGDALQVTKGILRS